MIKFARLHSGFLYILQCVNGDDRHLYSNLNSKENKDKASRGTVDHVLVENGVAGLRAGREEHGDAGSVGGSLGRIFLNGLFGHMYSTPFRQGGDMF